MKTKLAAFLLFLFAWTSTFAQTVWPGGGGGGTNPFNAANGVLVVLPTGVASVDGPALQSAVTTAIVSGAAVQIGCGHLVSTTQISATVPDNKKLAIHGLGSNCAFVDFQGTNGFSITYGGPLAASDIEGFTETTNGTTYNGIVVNSPNGTGGGAIMHYLRDVVFQGNDFTSAGGTNYWAQAATYTGVTNLNVEGGGCNAISQHGNCYLYQGANCTGAACVNAYAVQANFIAVSMLNCNVGILAAEWWQGVTVSQPNITQCNKGISTGVGIDGITDGLEQLTITGGSINAFVCNICVNAVWFLGLQVSNNYLIVESGGVGIIVRGAGNTIIGNELGDVGLNNAIAIEFSSSDPFPEGETTIEGNIAVGFKYAVQVNTNVSANTLIAHNYFQCLFSGSVCVSGSATYNFMSGSGLITLEDDIAEFFANLPTCNTGLKFSKMIVEDSAVNTYYTTITGGGTNPVQALCNGTNWITN